MIFGNAVRIISRISSKRDHLYYFSRAPISTTISKMDVNFEGKDATQVKLMEQECILVDNNDSVIGSSSKKNCHLLENINKGMLHRAFSVLLFNSKNELLLQQRSSEKITYPDHWTNTCCSHPLNTTLELDEEDAIGVRRAARRKLQHELGIKPEEMPLDSLTYLTRIQYKSENVPRDGLWGEHEIDYVLVAKKDVDLDANKNEVRATRYVNKQQLRQLMDSNDGTLITPWFRLIAENYLQQWWENLETLQNCKDHKNINRF